MLCKNHKKNLTLSGALLTLCPRRYAIPRIAIVTYYLMTDYLNCAPSPNGGLVAQEGGFVLRENCFYRASFHNRIPIFK
jgi:hypothetical protein